MSEVKNRVEVINPVEFISVVLKQNGYGDNLGVGHIKYDETVNDNFDYQIIRSSSHDGTHLFTYMLLGDAVLPLINKQTYCKNTITEDELKRLWDIEYVIGDIKLETTYGKVEVKAGEISGLTNIVTIPVRCKYIFH